MSRGIYIVANDRVMESAIALLASIGLYNSQVPVFLIPFDDNYLQVAAALSSLYGVQLYPNLGFVEQFTREIGQIFDRNFLALPNKMRKLCAWFGPLDEFLYIDTDIIVFEDIAANLNKLSEVDFFCCDYHHLSEKLRNVFSPVVKEQNIFTDSQLQDVFNSGFWASRKGTITEAQMYETLRECAQHREYFDFTQNVTDQPILNYMILKLIVKRWNLVKDSAAEPGSWAGSTHFQERDYVLYDKGKRLKYIHWAGIPIKSGSPYWKLWQHYRYLDEGKPTLVQRLFRYL
ncbi:MAG: methionine synthase [Microcoleus sp. PH2017_10_PVI_O_A]|uniref:Npun_R2821/Npun_R2822 family protein n=1 Tax=unclassified Microcoleus TaxID=2642155 RepID=UPI001DF48061|nr:MULTISPECIES: Npun_R2821/Npun_R2822 family protein [unclassified Microcoleus]TAE82999.1 MAG: methionine synthase [Oscillatoriales cyanobacterium]MCC3406565.1 methionine synthase [Microcoleus sp. PH2017_10_PVI_O_A]MCC3460578.1 methionine synthase [Microcoleus sp. PH2017_11_PCY_U_A]MCC3479069.1 methionine synthase [Microcoleus sp. PH2017_12_PCY_D_A]MCC3528925.1 methionine synthase [Microcoleus sp. PH2017_21_RUC_O_A]